MRVEQLYPFPSHALADELLRFKELETVVWCQEEPMNMGSWSFIDPLIEETLKEVGGKVKRPAYAGRKAAASPATGLMDRHKKEQAGLVDQALTIKKR